MTFLAVAVLAFSLAVSVNAVNAQEDEPQTQAETPAAATQTVYGVIESEPSLASFETLVEAAGLSDNLRQDGPFTVFAPTDEAWAAFEAIAAETDATMTEILLYHVLNGDYPAASIRERRALPTLFGGYLFFQATGVGADAGMMLNESANVLRTDIRATNGVVHVIDAVVPSHRR